MVDEIVTRQELIDAKRDARDLGKAVNEKVIVSPRYGEDFKSLPMIAAEFQISSDAAEAAAQSAQSSASSSANSANNASSSANVAEAAATAATISAGVFETPEAGVDPVTGVADGAYFNVRSSNDDSYIDEYQNVGGSAVATGKRYLSALGVELQEKSASTIKTSDGLNLQEFIDYNNSLMLDYNRVVHVGDNEVHKSISSALEALSASKPILVMNDDSEFRANIILRSGFVAQEQININGIDLSFVTITSEDPEVIINRAALTKKVGRWYSFIRVKNGAIPTIGTLFDMDKTGTGTERVGLYMINARGFVNEYCGIKNSGDRNVDIKYEGY